jgi:hypothetical protein
MAPIVPRGVWLTPARAQAQHVRMLTPGERLALPKLCSDHPVAVCPQCGEALTKQDAQRLKRSGPPEPSS